MSYKQCNTFVLSIFLLLLDPCYHLDQQRVGSTKGHMCTTIRHGFHVSGRDTAIFTTAHVVGECVLLCARHDGCRSVSFDSTTKQCRLNKVDLVQGLIVEKVDTSVYVGCVEDPWTMVFRATSGIEQSVLEAWNNVGHADDVTQTTSASYGCLTVDGRLPCDRHFRFQHLDDVTRFKEAMFAFYVEGELVAHVTFDAQSATEWNDVFKFEKVINSTYEDLTQDVAKLDDLCSVEGYDLCVRRFYMTHVHDTCSRDRGWIMVSEPTTHLGCCSWETQGAKPAFRYSTVGTAVVYSSADLGYADTFVVYVKL